MKYLYSVSRLILSTLMFVCAAVPRVEGQPAPMTYIGWDLTYQTLLANNHSNFIWLRSGEQYVSPITPLLEAWHGPMIEASVLLEFPAGHGEAHGALWFVRTKSGASYTLVFVGPPDVAETNKLIEIDKFEHILKTVTSWQQRSHQMEHGYFGADYCGFLSLYDGHVSRQFLLTVGDFVVSDEAAKIRNKPGRVLDLFGQFLNVKLPNPIK